MSEKFKSIPETMYWSVATITTIGYGDIYPITILGKLLTSFIAIMGVATFAIPTAIFASGFSEHLDGNNYLSKLDKLGSLHSNGVITNDEFLELKKDILSKIEK